MRGRVDYTLSHCISTLIRDIADELSATRKPSSLTVCRRTTEVNHAVPFVAPHQWFGRFTSSAVPMRLPDTGRLAGGNLRHADFGTLRRADI